MFIGEYKHSIDAKKRLALPVKFRRALGDKVVVTRGLDNCLAVYPMNEWKALADKLGKLPIGRGDARGFARIMLAGAMSVDFDSLGRILVPDYLKEYAGLKKKVIITGLYNRLEIWDEEKWNKYRQSLEKNINEMTERLEAEI